MVFYCHGTLCTGRATPDEVAGAGAHHSQIQWVTYENRCGASARVIILIGPKRRTLDAVSKSRHRFNARKIGLALSGSTIGNRALKTRKKAFIASCIDWSPSVCDLLIQRNC